MQTRSTLDLTKSHINDFIVDYDFCDNETELDEVETLSINSDDYESCPSDYEIDNYTEHYL